MSSPEPFRTVSIKEEPEDDLDIEYTERYGRDHEGDFPPQTTRKYCIMGAKICENPCPICRDPSIIIHHQNVKLLEQFINPDTGMAYDHTHTGLCMQQQKRLNEAINRARDYGFLPFKFPNVEFTEDSNTHHAVGFNFTPPPLCLNSVFLHLPVCKEAVSPEMQKWRPSLVQEEPEPPRIKEEQEEQLQRAEEADGSTSTLPAVKSEDDDKNRDTEPVASTSTEHMKTQAYVKNWVASQATSDEQLLSSHCSESDTEDRDDWEETREDQSGSNTLKSHKTQHAESQHISLSNKPSQDLKSSKPTHSMRSHTEKKSYSCTFCGKTFKRRGHLNRHTMTHTGEKLFNCTVCGKMFNRTGHLKTHMMIHTGERPFTCAVCGKGCVHMGHLKQHMRTHTGEKPFSCSVCGQGCVHMGQLNTHMRTHTGEKPFTCTVCSKGFGQMGNLNTHMKTHKGGKNI